MKLGNHLVGSPLLVVAHSPVAVALLLTGMLLAGPANAAEVRVLRGFDDPFDDSQLLATAFDVADGRVFRANRLELTVGGFVTRGQIRPMVSLGPVWRAGSDSPWFLEAGFAPTLLSSPSIGGDDSGGLFHFTSSLAVGRSFGRNRSVTVGLRYQHSSNGNLRHTNPGIDMLGVAVWYAPGNSR